MDPSATQAIADGIRAELRKTIVGQDKTVDLLLTALLAGGHVLLEGVPGTAKTLIAQSFAAALSLQFGRIQFTPDLMPGDLLGTNLFNFQTNKFVLTKGPIFTEVLLADEVNRSPPKTQSAMLQAMNERSITIDGQNYPLSESFMVIATQNPIEQQGTYPLPEAQLDRFLFKIDIPYPTYDDECEIVRRHGTRSAMPRVEDYGLVPVIDDKGLRELRSAVANVTLSEDIVTYIVELIRGTREHAGIEVGASPRAAIMVASASRAYATLQRRDFVVPDDVKALADPTLRHRITLTAAAEIEGLTANQVLGQIVDRTKAPR
jgi:MoxR-like ATPase